jgi:tRNA 2-thiouridine synthesizing protein A
MTEPLDLCGLKCPMPALMARRAVWGIAPGAQLEVFADDPMAAVDIPHMAHQEGFEIVASTRDGAIIRVTLRRPG